jgi:hypothetical protein
MRDIRITPGSSTMSFTSSLSFTERITQDPSGSLNLYGSGSTGRTELFSIDGNNGRLFTVSDDLSDSLFSVNTIAGLPVIEAFANNTVVLGQYGANALVVTGSRVGIGTTSPSERLTVDGNVLATQLIRSGGTSSQFLKADGSVDSSTYALDNAVVKLTGGQTISGQKTFQNTLNAAGGINVDDAFGLYWKTDVTEPGGTLVGIGQSSSGLNFFTGGTFTAKMIITSGGNVGIGTTSPSERLHVIGTILASADVIAYSDARVKTNIRPIENVLERINLSRGVLYDRTDVESTNNIGFIAQELEQQFPELVKTDKEGKKSVAYQNTVAILFEAIKEQQKQIEQLTKLVNQLNK